MKKILKSVLAVALVMITIFSNVQPASALEEYEVNLGVDMATAFSNWTPISAYSNGAMQYPGNWSYNSAGYIVNAENTSNMTGFYNPTTNYSDMDITMKMGSWNSDDDTLGCMIRFSEDSNHNCTGYIFAYDRGGATHGGLYKINGGQFKTSSLVQLVSFPTVKWTYQAYDTVRIKASGDNIQVWVNGTKVANYTDSDPIEAGSYGFFSFSQADSRFTSITGTAELAHFTAAFNANGGTLSGNSSKTVTSTKTYGTLPTATRTGYTFAGWYDAKTGGNKITSTSTVNIAADTTFYAHWTPIASTVNFDANGGTVSTTSKTVYYDGTMGTMPTPTRKGYTFKGWCTDKNGAGEYVTSDYKIAWTTATTSTLYAQWTINEYSIKTSSTGLGVISNDTTVVYSEDASIFIEPAEGFDLTELKIDGVSVAPVKSYIFSNVENNHTVEATFTMTQTRKMELLSKGYDWIDLKLN